MTTTDITATVSRPAGSETDDWNWAEEATTAWLIAAREAGVTVDAEDHSDHGGSVAARVQVEGTWYDLEVGRGGDHDEVRAIETEV